MDQGSPGTIIMRNISERLGHSPDLICQKFSLFDRFEIYCTYFESIVTTDQVNELLIKPIVETNLTSDCQTEQPLEWMKKHIPHVRKYELTELNKCIDCLLDGQCLLIHVDTGAALSYDVYKTQSRSIAEPITEATIRGPREGFIESLIGNVALIRKRIKNEQLVFESMTLGEVTKTKLYLVYMNNIATVPVVEEFRARLRVIKTDSVLESSYIEEWIQDRTLTPFPQLLSTERPDVVTAKLLEGQVAILTDGTPVALIGPITFFQFFTSPEDYYQRADIATLLRWLRMFAFLLAIFVPALYIAVVSFHQEMLPTLLLINLAAQREVVPFPALIEASLMMVTFELLREAGLRMPRIAGQAISIVGALVLGQSAVEAGIVSTAMVIVVSITAISNFISPSYSFGIAQRIIQFFFMALAGMLGLFGLSCGVFILLIHLASLRSFGVKYLSPLAPAVLSDWKDTFIRVPRPYMTRKTKHRETKGE